MLKVIKMGAVWCPPCQILNKVFDKIAAATEGVEFVHVDIDEEPELAEKFEVRSVPTIIFEVDGVKVDTIVGLVAEQTIIDKIEEHK